MQPASERNPILDSNFILESRTVVSGMKPVCLYLNPVLLLARAAGVQRAAVLLGVAAAVVAALAVASCTSLP